MNQGDLYASDMCTGASDMCRRSVRVVCAVVRVYILWRGSLKKMFLMLCYVNYTVFLVYKTKVMLFPYYIVRRIICSKINL